jgi:6-phosphogluconolactonase
VNQTLFLKDGLRVFDLIILGMGCDGYTASIFPNQIDLLNSDAICAIAIHPDSGQHRITLTGRVINAARQVHFLVTGALKNLLIKEIFFGIGNYASYSVAHIENAEWWIDDEAGA